MPATLNAKAVADTKADGTLIELPATLNAKLLNGVTICRGSKPCTKCRKVQVECFSAHPGLGTDETPPTGVIKDLYRNENWVVRPECLTCWWNAQLGPLRVGSMNRPPTDRDAIMAEVHRLEGVAIDPYPAMATTLRALAEQYPGSPSDPPFPTGRVSRSPNALALLGLDTLRDFLGRHQQGDFGTLGNAGDAVDSDAVRWCPWAFPIPTRNVAAVRSGIGTVESRYEIPQPGKSTEYLRIITVNRPGFVPETVLITGRDTQFLSYNNR